MKLIALMQLNLINKIKKAYKNTLLNLTWKITLQIKLPLKKAPVNHFKESNMTPKWEG